MWITSPPWRTWRSASAPTSSRDRSCRSPPSPARSTWLGPSPSPPTPPARCSWTSACSTCTSSGPARSTPTATRLGYVPPWIGARATALGEHRCARIGLTGPVAPRIMDDVDPALLGLDMLPAVPEGMVVINERTTNWTVDPVPHARVGDAGASAAGAGGGARAAVAADRAHLPARRGGSGRRLGVADRPPDRRRPRELDARRLDALRFEGPGTDLTIGLLPASTWLAARFETVDGIVHTPNLPTEEVFTTPDPERVDGIVSATKPLFTSGTTITGLQVRFEGGRAVAIEADQGAEVLRGLAAHDAGAARLGEVALVDREGRIGPLDTVFFDTLLDENAASHIALGAGLRARGRRRSRRSPTDQRVRDPHRLHDRRRSRWRLPGTAATASEIPVLRAGSWQI